MFREIKSITFEIQTVGRIMRMPELKHYDNEIMNKAYVYTNFAKINIETGEASKYIKAKQSKINPIYENIVLPKSIYLKRLDYNDLSPANDFHKIFHNVFLKEIK
jgi:type III restriction enzyme